MRGCLPHRNDFPQGHDHGLKRQATAKDLEKLEELCYMVQEMSLCGLGQSAPNPVLSTLRYFNEEYQELLIEEPVYVNGRGR